MMCCHHETENWTNVILNGILQIEIFSVCVDIKSFWASSQSTVMVLQATIVHFTGFLKIHFKRKNRFLSFSRHFYNFDPLAPLIN